jgi:hypothetical protein
MLQAALLFWENLNEFLTKELGFTANPYDRCVVNRMIKGYIYKDIFKGIKLHLSSRVIAWLPAPVGTKQINTTSKQAT